MRTTQPEAGRLRRYGIALSAVVVAFVATYTTWPLLKPTPWAFFFAAVMASAWFGGQGPSLVATAVTAILGQYFFIEPYGSFTIGADGLVPILVFLAVSLFMGLLASDRRRAEGHERAERTRFQATVTSIGDAVIATDAAGRVTFMNGVAEELTGWSAPEAEGRRLEEVFVIVNAETRKPAPSPVKNVLGTGRIQGLANHTVLIARDGSERPIDDSAAPIKNERHELTGVVLVFRDVTEKRRTEEELRDARGQLESALSAGSIATWTWDIPNDRVVSDANLAQLFSISPQVARGGPLSSYLNAIHPEDREEISRVIGETIASGVTFDEEYRVVQADGSARWVVARGKVERDAEGRPLSLSGIMVDITERREAEKDRQALSAQLAAQARVFDTALSNAADFIYTFDARGPVHLRANRRFARFVAEEHG